MGQHKQQAGCLPGEPGTEQERPRTDEGELLTIITANVKPEPPTPAPGKTSSGTLDPRPGMPSSGDTGRWHASRPSRWKRRVGKVSKARRRAGWPR
eukprot:11313463-Heterocapsa_arctica.AAC.1